MYSLRWQQWTAFRINFNCYCVIVATEHKQRVWCGSRRKVLVAVNAAVFHGPWIYVSFLFL